MSMKDRTWGKFWSISLEAKKIMKMHSKIHDMIIESKIVIEEKYIYNGFFSLFPVSTHHINQACAVIPRVKTILFFSIFLEP